MANADEAWGMGSGLALDGMTGVITAAEFGFNANIGAGIVCLNLTIEDTEDADAEEVEQSFSCGNKFEASRDGSELVGGGKIIKTSNYGILLGSLAECVDDVATDLPDFDPRVAASWVGLHATWGSIQSETTNPTTQVKSVKDKFIITEFHGFGEAEAEAKPAKKSAAKKAAASTKKASSSRVGGAKADPNAAPEGVDDELWAELLALANEHDDHGDFATAALDIEAVDGNKAAQKAIMGTKAGSVWAAKEAANG